MPTLPAECPVAIIGAGPTGLTLALLLAGYGIRSVVLERNARPMDIPRAIVLDDEGARILQIFGADAAVTAQSLPGDGAAYLDDAGVTFARVGAGPETFGFPKRLFINQPEMEAALRQALDRTPLSTLHFSTEVTDLAQDGSGVTVALTEAGGRSRSLRAGFVVAADGGRSPTRERLGIALSGSTYAQDWLVIDTLNDPDTARFTRFHCSDRRPKVRVPAPGGGKRYEFMLLPGETPEQVLDPGFVRDLVRPFRQLDDADILRKTIYTFHARIAERWQVGRVFLAGDAAHLTPPFAGQGMNAGLRDAGNLGWKLAAVLRGGASAAILGSYEAERRAPAWAMIRLAVVMGDVVMPIDPAQIAFRQQLLDALRPFPAVQEYFLQMKFKPRPRHDTGLHLDLGSQPFDGAIVGEMVAQPDVTLNGEGHKLDVLLGPGFALLAQDAAGARALAALKGDTFAGLPLARVWLPFGAARSARRAPLPPALCDDPRARPFRAHRDQVLLIRPDRYCAAAFAPGDLAGGLARYAGLLGLTG